MKPRKITNNEAVEMASKICARDGIELSITDLINMIRARRDDGRPKYFCAWEIITPKLKKKYVIADNGDFKERLSAAIKHYDANKPLVIGGKVVTEADILDPGFDWKRLDEEDE